MACRMETLLRWAVYQMPGSSIRAGASIRADNLLHLAAADNAHRQPTRAAWPRRAGSPLINGTGSEPSGVNTGRTGAREVPVPFFNGLLG